MLLHQDLDGLVVGLGDQLWNLSRVLCNRHSLELSQVSVLLLLRSNRMPWSDASRKNNFSWQDNENILFNSKSLQSKSHKRTICLGSVKSRCIISTPRTVFTVTQA